MNESWRCLKDLKFHTGLQLLILIVIYVFVCTLKFEADMYFIYLPVFLMFSFEAKLIFT